MRQISGTQAASAHTAAASLSAAYATRRAIPAVVTGTLIAPRPAEVAKPKAEPTGRTRTRKAAELHRCRCSELVLENGEWTGCEKMVKGTFAPGHDAKAASLVIRAAKLGEENRARYAANELGEENGRVYDEAAQCWRNPLEIFEGTKLGQKVAAKLGQAEATRRQAAEIYADKVGASEESETEATDAEKAAKPGKVLKIVQHRRAGAFAGRDTETSDAADLAWEDVTHPADAHVGADIAWQEMMAGA